MNRCNAPMNKKAQAGAAEPLGSGMIGMLRWPTLGSKAESLMLIHSGLGILQSQRKFS